MKRFLVIILLTLLSSLMTAQQKYIVNYSFQENSMAYSKSTDIRINMLIGKTVVGVSGSDNVILKGSNFLNLKPQVNNEIALQENKMLPAAYSLEQNYPNPFNPVTRIRYSILKEGYVSLSIYNMLGEKVQQLVDETRSAGTYTVDWDAGGFTSGIYLYSIKSGNFSASKKLILVK